MCEVTASRLAAFRVEKGTSCQVDGAFLSESLSGNWGKLPTFEMSRDPHKNGKGVATRRFQHYLDWFSYREQFRKSDADGREATFADAAAGKYQTSRRVYALAPHPFVEYWGNGAMSTVV